ncbi:MAG: hypothetical protein AB7S80_11520 [Rhizobiaceae bacterium]
MTANNRAAFVSARRRLLLAAVALLACFGFVLPIMGGTVNAINLFGVVVSFGGMADVSLIGLVLSLFWFAERMNALERRFADSEP